MSGIEVLVIVLCLVAGYWIVLKLMSRPRQQKRGIQQGSIGSGVVGVPPWSLPEDPNGVAWSGVLGVDANATVEEIRRAYAEQSAQYHPGKVVELGAEI